MLAVTAGKWAAGPFIAFHFLLFIFAPTHLLFSERIFRRSPTLLQYSGYCEEELLDCARQILRAKQTQSSELKAVTKKYSSSRYGNVSSTAIATDF